MHYQSIVRRIVVWLVSILFAFRLRPVWRVWWAAVSVGAVGAVGAVEIAFGDVFFYYYLLFCITRALLGEL